MADFVAKFRIMAVDLATAPLRKIGDGLEKIGREVRTNFKLAEDGIKKANAAVEAGRKRAGPMLQFAADASLAANAAQRFASFTQDAFIAPINTARAFEQQMMRVRALSGATREDFVLLSDQAEKLGASTIFSASQAGSAMESLAVAGFKTKEILSAMPGLLDLAAASASDLGETASITSDILGGFGLQANEAGRVGDVLVKTFTNSNTNLSLLGLTMSYAAPAAAALGVSMEEVAGAAGQLANAGIKGSRAGTALNQVFARLTQLSFSKDAAGNLRSFGDILNDLNKRLVGKGTVEQGRILAKVFGLEAAPAVNALLAAAKTGKLEEFTKMLGQAGGAAKKVAADAQETANGGFAELESSVEGVAITLGKPFLEPLRKVVLALASVLSRLTDLAKKYPKITTAVATAAGVFVLFTTAVAGALTVVAAIAGTVGLVLLALSLSSIIAPLWGAIGAMTIFGVTLSAAFLPVTLIALGIASLVALGVVLVKNWDGVASWFSNMWAAIKSDSLLAIAAMTDALANMLSFIPGVSAKLTGVAEKLRGEAANVYAERLMLGVPEALLSPDAFNKRQDARLHIQIDSDGKPRVVQQQATGFRMDLALDAGPTMATP